MIIYLIEYNWKLSIDLKLVAILLGLWKFFKNIVVFAVCGRVGTPNFTEPLKFGQKELNLFLVNQVLNMGVSFHKKHECFTIPCETFFDKRFCKVYG